MRELRADLSVCMRAGALPEYTAALGGHTECLQVLREAGRRIDNSANRGTNPLFIACSLGHVGVVRIGSWGELFPFPY